MVDDYGNGWLAKSGGAFDAETTISLNNLSETRQLARAMFALEAGRPSPLHDDQIDFGIANERANTLPL